MYIISYIIYIASNIFHCTFFVEFHCSLVWCGVMQSNDLLEYYNWCYFIRLEYNIIRFNTLDCNKYFGCKTLTFELLHYGICCYTLFFCAAISHYILCYIIGCYVMLYLRLHCIMQLDFYHMYRIVFLYAMSSDSTMNISLWYYRILCCLMVCWMSKYMVLFLVLPWISLNYVTLLH